MDVILISFPPTSIASILPFSLSLESNLCGEMLEQDYLLGFLCHVPSVGQLPFLQGVKSTKEEAFSLPVPLTKNRTHIPLKKKLPGPLVLADGQEGKRRVVCPSCPVGQEEEI